MRVPLLKAFGDVAVAALSGAMMYAAFPSANLSVFAWVGLAPLLLVVSGKRALSGFLLFYMAGGIFFLGVFHWILEVSGYTLLHHGILAVYLGAFFAVFGLLFAFISSRLGHVQAFVAAPFLWISLEYVRSNLSFMALPWALLSHSQYRNPLVIQIASLAGAYGVSFVILLANASLACLLRSFLAGSRSQDNRQGGKRGEVALVSATVIVLLFVIGYGHVKTRSPIPGDTVKIALVQGNIDQSRKWDPQYASKIMDVYTELTLDALDSSLSLVIWPETATPRAINYDQALYRKVKDLARSKGSHILLGSAQIQKFRVGEPKAVKYYNSAFLIGPEKGAESDQGYDKVRLLPFGEYLPYREKIPWSLIGIKETGGYLPGKGYKVLNHPQIALGVTICWENIFPDVVREFVKGGAQCIVNITNEAWFGKTAAPYQFLSMSVLRAVEHRLYVLRCANTGISCLIDPCGRVVERIEEETGVDIFIPGVLKGSIIPAEKNTFYTACGDWPVYLGFALSVLFLACALLRKPLP
jgi:apolipoprotein N-acyltransferase